MRILVITPEELPLPPIEGGSVETNTYHTFRRMARTERVTILSAGHPKLPAVSSRGKLKFIRVKPGRPGNYIRSALRKVKGKKFDIIQIENRPNFVPHVRRQFPHTPIVLSLHSLIFLSRLSRRRAHAVLSKVNTVTSVVDFLTQTMKKQHPRHAHKFKTATLGVDTAKFRPRSSAFKRKLRRRWGVAGTFNLMFAGRIIRRKGLHTLVKAAAKLKKRSKKRLRIVAVGASWPGVKRITPYMKKVRRMSKRLGVPIKFTGYIKPVRMPLMYHLGDVFVCPTQFREGFGTVNAEAMASGIPVVASSRGGVRNVIRHGRSGLLVKAYKSPNAFANAIGRVRASAKLKRRLANGGRSRAKRLFSWKRTVMAFKRHYRNLR